MNNKIKKKSPVQLKWLTKILPAAKAFATANPLLTAGLIIGGTYLASKARKKDRALRRQLGEAQEDFDRRLKEYEESKFQPIDPNLADQENIFEDMEIDTTGFEMQRKAFLQQQANILQGLQMVSDKQSEQMGMTISQAINRAKELRLQEESRISQNITNIQIANAEGARQFELDKLSTLLGVAGQKIAGIRGDQAGRRQMYGQIAQGFGSVAGAFIGKA